MFPSSIIDLVKESHKKYGIYFKTEHFLQCCYQTQIPYVSYIFLALSTVNIWNIKAVTFNAKKWACIFRIEIGRFKQFCKKRPCHKFRKLRISVIYLNEGLSKCKTKLSKVFFPFSLVSGVVLIPLQIATKLSMKNSKAVLQK